MNATKSNEMTELKTDPPRRRDPVDLRASFGALLAGLLFALGLGIGGMTRPEKVQAFLDFAGDWDPALAGVMAGAIIVYSIGYRLVVKRSFPFYASKFRIPTNRTIDKRLVAGAAIFGVGWGLAGFCPGPALTAAATGAPMVLFFIAAMGVGMGLHEILVRRTDARRRAADTNAASPDAGDPARDELIGSSAGAVNP